jgi:hypothetical protein
VRDLVAHLGTWLAEAEVQLARIGGGTYESHEVDIDALNAALLAGMEGQPWEVAWIQANAARTEMLDAWTHLHALDDEAGRWIRKSGSDHYDEHLERLRQWCAELVRRRATDTAAVPGGPATQGMAGRTRLEPTPPTGAEGAP